MRTALHDMRGQHYAADSRLRNSGIIPIRPSIGPGRRSQAVFAPSNGKQIDAMVMEITVIRKPMLFWMASALPTIFGGQARADSAENCGESETTVTPQNNRTVSRSALDNSCNSGNSRHIAPEAARENAATYERPMRRLSRPPAMQPTAPAPMTANAQPDTVDCAAPLSSADTSRNGAIVQNAYSSHM